MIPSHNQTVKAQGVCAACEHSSLEAGRVVCSKLAKTVDFYDASVNCPIGKWESVIGKYVYVRGSSTPIPQMPDRATVVKSAWYYVTDLAAKAAQFGTTVTGGFADEETVAARRASCDACEKLVRGADGHLYCGACGCGQWPLSRLDEFKLKFAKLPCPLDKPGFFK